MVSIVVCLVSLCLLALAYPLVVLILILWVRVVPGHQGHKNESPHSSSREQRVDRIKEKAFLITAAVIFFAVAPFVTFLLMGTIFP